MVSGYDVELIDDEKMDEFIVKFKGPVDSPYSGVSYSLSLWAALKPETPVRPTNIDTISVGRMESSGYVARSVPY